MLLDYDDELTGSGAAGASGHATLGQAFVGAFGTPIIGTKPKGALGAARDWGSGEIVSAYVRVGTAFAGNTGGVTVEIIGCDAADGTGNVVVLATRTIALADLTVESLHSLPALLGGYPRNFLVGRITPLTANSTGGTAKIGLVNKDGRPQNIMHQL